MPRLIKTVELSPTGTFPLRDTEFTVVDFETTSLHPPGRIIEIGAVRMRGDGTILGELSTLVDPGRGVSPGATRIHGITRRDLNGAPAIAEVVGDLLAMCRDSVVVAHNLSFEDKFLAHELDLIGVAVPEILGVCTLRTARRAMSMPNYRLATLVYELGLPAVASHAALDDARACARLLATLIAAPYNLGLTRAPRYAPLPLLPAGSRHKPRTAAHRGQSWLGGLMDQLPLPADREDDLVVSYIELLTAALADGQITQEEAAALARQARQAGLSSADLQRIHQDVLTGLRQTALEDGVITDAEHRQLVTAATVLGMSDFFSSLTVDRITQPGPLRALRILILGTSDQSEQLRQWCQEGGARIAKNLTATVTHLVVDDTVSATEPRRHKAALNNIPVLDVDQAQQILAGIARPSPSTALREPAVPQRPDRHSARPVPAPVAQPINALPTVPAGTSGHSVPRLWGGRILLTVGVILIALALFALLGGVPADSFIVTMVLGGLLALGGRRLIRSAHHRRTNSAAETDRSRD